MQIFEYENVIAHFALTSRVYLVNKVRVGQRRVWCVQMSNAHLVSVHFFVKKYVRLSPLLE